MSNDGGEESNSKDGDETADDGVERPLASTATLSLDETLELLSNYERRRIIEHLINAPDGTAKVGELVDHLAARKADRTGERPGRNHVKTTLHHVHLPKLADAGVVDYDARSQEVRYRTDDRLEEWHECIDESENN